MHIDCMASKRMTTIRLDPEGLSAHRRVDPMDAPHGRNTRTPCYSQAPTLLP